MARKIYLSDYDFAKEEAKKTILSNGLLIYPTDTLYGIGCNALSNEAVSKIYSIKAREGKKPLSVIMADLKMIEKYCTLSAKQKKILISFLPGPYTFILPLKKSMPASQTMKIGARVPEHIFARQICRELSLPIVSTSANISGKKSPTSAREIDKKILSSADLLIDGGKCIYGKPSTVIDLVEMRVVRKGAVREGDKFEW